MTPGGPVELRPPAPLVDAAWLHRRLGRPGLVVADARWRPDGSARALYEGGHLPGAMFVDVDRDLSGPKSPTSGRHPLPSPEDFAAAMDRAGIGDDTVVIAYDDQGGSTAARLWWMLDVTGHPAAVLDGGLQAWPGKRETGPGPAPGPVGGMGFTPLPWPRDRWADAEEVDRLRRDPLAVVLDARAAERYRGETEPIDPVAGHIPGAVNAPWSENLDPATGRFLDPDELRRRYPATIGAQGSTEVVAYCGSGVTSCHDLLALEVAGLPGARLYVGSWSEWVADPSRPVAAGPDPG
jgi:thiosulfate/3-mercaptopyruvate sulfurtransferase